MTSKSVLAVELLLVALFFVGAWLGALLPIQEFDIWMHLATGKYIAATGTVPRTDLYSFTAGGRAWIYHEWGFALLAFWLVDAWGINALVFLQASLVVAIFAFLYVILLRIIRDNRTAVAFSLIGLSCGYVIMKTRFLIRPQLFSLLFMVMILYLLYRRDRAKWFIPLIFIPWGNIHAEFMWGLVIIAVWAAVSWCAEKKIGAENGAILLLSAAMACVNPYGWRIYLLPLKIASYTEFQRIVTEWQPPGAEYALGWYLAVLAVIAVCALSTLGRQRYFEILLAMLGMLAMIKARRYMTMSVCFLAPLYGYAALRWSRGLKSSWPARLLLLAAAAAVMVIVFVEVVPVGVGLGVREKTFPFPAYAYIQNNGLVGRTLATYTYATGLVMTGYPDNPNFLDGRWGVYDENLLRIMSAMMNGRDTPQLLDEWGIDVVLLRVNPFSFTEERFPPIATVLAARDDWGLVFWDDISAIYVRRAAFADFAGYYKKAWPFLRPEEVGAELEMFQDDFDRAITGTGYNSWSYMILGNALQARGDWGNAIHYYVTALLADEGNAAILTELGETFLRCKQIDDGLTALTAAIQYDEMDYQAYALLGYYFLDENKLLQSERYLEQALSLAPQSARIRYALARSYLLSYKTAGAENILYTGWRLTHELGYIVALGGMYQQQGDYARAGEYYTYYLVLAPDDIQARYALATCLLKQKEYDAALEQYQQLGARGENSARYFNDLSATLIFLQRYDEAEENLRNALRIDPANEYALTNLELVHQMESGPITEPRQAAMRLY